MNTLSKILNFIHKLENFFIIIFLVFFLYLILGGFQNTEKDKEYNSTKENVDTYKSEYVSIKYRDDKVNVSDFEYFYVSINQMVREAWYDKYNNYFIINLRNTKYHYCDFPEDIWLDFKKSTSIDYFYDRFIYGKYDCRESVVPTY